MKSPPEVLLPDERAQIPQPWFHPISGDKSLVLLMENSQLFEIGTDLFTALNNGDETAIAELKAAIPITDRFAKTWHADTEPSAISLNLAQSCNLACSYCYADEGRFGGQQRSMSADIALATIEQFIKNAPKKRVTIGFIGGEPFVNRATLYQSVAYAKEVAAACGISVGFSVTTNGTLITPEDITWLRENAFAVSVSIDGGAGINDLHRRDRRETGSFDRIVRNLQPLLAHPGHAKIAARATIARDDLRILERVDALGAIGFPEVGVSPLRTSPQPELVFAPDDWSVFLQEMIRTAEAEWERVLAGGQFRFSNLAIALKEIHKGSCRPLPCGAAANYVSVNADGNYFSCHRTIDDPRFALGTLATGLDRSARERFLQSRLVDRQEPCRSCWARYLCGGGCHAEVIESGRDSCDYIRGWLEYCLSYYNRLLSIRPDLFYPTPPQQP
jgi:uncharacterized protein